MRKKYIFLVVTLLCLFTGLNLKAQRTLGLMTKLHESTQGYVLFSPNSYAAHYLIDKCGNLVNEWKVKNTPGLDAFILPNGNLLTTGNTSNPYFSGIGTAGGLIQIYNWKDSLIWSYLLSDSLERQDHDVYPMPNGNILLCVWERHVVDEAVLAGKDTAVTQSSPVWSAKVIEIQPVGSNDAKIVWQWSLWNHLVQDHDSTMENYGVVAEHPELLNINYIGVGPFGNPADWIHANAVTYNSDLDQVMISSRNLSEIWILDHSTSRAEASTHSGGKYGKGGDFLYRWGNPEAYEMGDSTDRRLFVQHNPTWIPKGYPGENDIMIFNDGNGRIDGNYSSVDIIHPPLNILGKYNLDSNNTFGPDTAYWSYKAPNKEEFYSATEGGAQRLKNGNTLICESTKGHFFEIDSSKNIVWDYVNPVGPGGPMPQGLVPQSNAVFRCTLYDTGYSGFTDKKLVSGLPIEINPIMPLTCSTSGIEESKIVGQNSINVINPFNDVISLGSNISISGNTIQLSDIEGKTLIVWKNIDMVQDERLILNIPGYLKPGIYILRIDNKTGPVSLKLIHY